ncbi:hypothetical protein [Archaeoglobus sp.]
MEKKKKSKENQKRTPFDLITGKEVVFQLLRGPIIEGVFAGKHDRFFILTNAEIKGKNHICKTDLIFIHMNQVQHFHLKGEVKKITG